MKFLFILILLITSLSTFSSSFVRGVDSASSCEAVRAAEGEKGSEGKGFSEDMLVFGGEHRGFDATIFYRCGGKSSQNITYGVFEFEAARREVEGYYLELSEKFGKADMYMYDKVPWWKRLYIEWFEPEMEWILYSYLWTTDERSISLSLDPVSPSSYSKEGDWRVLFSSDQPMRMNICIDGECSEVKASELLN